MKDKIKILFLASDPFRGRAPLRLDEEVRAIEHALRKGSARDRVELVACFAARARDLQDALMRHHPRIVHFAGHGKDEGGFYLGDVYGRPVAVGKEALAKMFGLSKGIEVVVMNGCDTLPIVDALREIVDYTIGTKQPLSDASAIDFAEAFYGALAMGETVQASFDRAVNQLELEENTESTIPVLRIRPGVDPAVRLVAEPAPGLAPNGREGINAPGGGQENTFETFNGEDVLIENRPGNENQVNRFGPTTVRGFTLRNGGSR